MGQGSLSQVCTDRRQLEIWACNVAVLFLWCGLQQDKSGNRMKRYRACVRFQDLCLGDIEVPNHLLAEFLVRVCMMLALVLFLSLCTEDVLVYKLGFLCGHTTFEYYYLSFFIKQPCILHTSRSTSSS